MNFRSTKSWLQENDIEIYSAHDERKFIVAETFIRSLRNNIYQYMTSISINVYNDKLYNTYNSTIKINPFDVKSSIYIDFATENNEKDSKLEAGEHVRVSK